VAEQGVGMVEQQRPGHVRPDLGDVIEQVGGDLGRVPAGRRDGVAQRGHERRIGVGPGRPQQVVRDEARPVASRGEHLHGSPVPGAALSLGQLAVGHLAEQVVAEAGRPGGITADEAGRHGPFEQFVQRVSRNEQHAGEIVDADIGPPHRHRGEHVTGWLVELAEMGPYDLVQAGGLQVELEPGLNGVRSGVRQGARVPVPAQQFTDEERVAGGQSEDAAQPRAGPPARLVEHQAFHHHPAHRRQPQPYLRLPDEHGQRFTRRTRPGRDQHGQRQAPAGPHQPAQQRERGRVEVMRVVGAQHHRTVGAQLVDVIERRLSRISRPGRVTQELAGDGEGIVAPALLAGHPEDLGLAGRDGSQDVPGQEGLADARRALDDDAYPRRCALPDHPADKLLRGPLHGGAVRRRRPIAGQISH
jgi:hypothetical protein